MKAEACKNSRATQHLQLAVNGISRACLLCSRLWCYPSLAMIPLVHWCDTGIMTKDMILLILEFIGEKTLKMWRKTACQKAIGTKNTTLSDRKIQSRLELCPSIMILHICSPSNRKFRSDESCFPIFVDWSAVSLVVHENIFDRLLFALLSVIPPFERGYKY